MTTQSDTTVGENNSTLGYGDATNGTDHWRDTYQNSAYYNKDHDYDRDYHPAYAIGQKYRASYDANTQFEDVEAELEKSWNETKGQSKLQWSEARQAASDAWNHMSQANR